MAFHFNVGRVGQALSDILREATYGLDELGKLPLRGIAVPFGSDAEMVLKSIANTVQYDVNGEFDTLLGKLGLGPIFDEDAKGPPGVNARFIVEWVGQDLDKLDRLIRKIDAASGPAAGGTPALDCGSLLMLLQAVGAPMFGALALLHDDLRPLLGVVPPPAEDDRH